MIWRFRYIEVFFSTITGVKNSLLLGSTVPSFPRSNSRRLRIGFRQEIISGSRKMIHWFYGAFGTTLSQIPLPQKIV